MRALRSVRLLAVVAAGVILASCSATTASGPSGVPFANARTAHPPSPSLPQHALITFDSSSNALAYWRMRRDGSKMLQPLSGSLGISNVYALAANGDVVIIANYSPAEIVTYNVKTGAQATMSDPYGGPVDVAVDRNGYIYALNASSVAVYKSGSAPPTELSCSHINNGQAIAVDNEGDVFVDGYGPGSFQGVVEYAAGSSTCTVPHLRASRGYIAGVGVDPTTDDLIVIDDPDLCAGGIEGRMIIYPRPYEQRTSKRHILNATYCAGTFRLDASSTRIFYNDATVSAGRPIIDQAHYPSGKYEGRYWLGYYSSTYFSGITTMPNTLPN